MILPNKKRMITGVEEAWGVGEGGGRGLCDKIAITPNCTPLSTVVQRGNHSAPVLFTDQHRFKLRVLCMRITTSFSVMIGGWVSEELAKKLTMSIFVLEEREQSINTRTSATLGVHEKTRTGESNSQ